MLAVQAVAGMYKIDISLELKCFSPLPLHKTFVQPTSSRALLSDDEDELHSSSYSAFFIWICSNALYIKYYAYVITYLAFLETSVTTTNTNSPSQNLRTTLTWTIDFHKHDCNDTPGFKPSTLINCFLIYVGLRFSLTLSIQETWKMI